MYTTLFHVLPTNVESKKELSKLVEATTEYLHEQGKTDCTTDEFAFIMTLDRYIELFEKAKSMIINDRFTVEYKGEKTNQIPGIHQFEIIPTRPAKVE